MVDRVQDERADASTVCAVATVDERRAAFVAGLRELVDFLVAHPEVPVPPYPVHLSFAAPIADAVDPDDAGMAFVADAARVLGVDVYRHDGGARAERRFGRVWYGVSYALRAAAARYSAALSYDGAVQP
jgi:hypothetical protein